MFLCDRIRQDCAPGIVGIMQLKKETIYLNGVWFKRGENGQSGSSQRGRMITEMFSINNSNVLTRS